MTSSYKVYWYYFKIIAIPACVLVALAIIVWKVNVADLREKQREETLGIIRAVIEDQTTRELLVPSIIVFGGDSTRREIVNDHVYALLINRYFAEKNGNTTFAVKNPLTPVFPIDKKGNYILTTDQLNSLQSHIEFLTKQIDRQVQQSQEAIGREIDSLNLWVSIWIGVIGFLGIFIPVIINIDTSRSAQTAVDQSSSAIASMKEAKPEIDKIPGIEAKIKSAELKLDSIETKSTTAEEKATRSEQKSVKAEQKSNALFLVYSVGKLISFEKDMSLLPRNKIVLFLKKILESIHKNILECEPICDQPIVKDSLQDLGIYLAKLSYYTKHIGQERTESLDKLSGKLLEIVKKKISDKDLKSIADDLDAFTKTL